MSHSVLSATLGCPLPGRAALMMTTVLARQGGLRCRGRDGVPCRRAALRKGARPQSKYWRQAGALLAAGVVFNRCLLSGYDAGG